MNKPKDVHQTFWDYLRRGLYATRTWVTQQIAASGGGIYGDKWAFVMEDDELIVEHDEEGNPFLVYELTE